MTFSSLAEAETRNPARAASVATRCVPAGTRWKPAPPVPLGRAAQSTRAARRLRLCRLRGAGGAAAVRGARAGGAGAGSAGRAGLRRADEPGRGAPSDRPRRCPGISARAGIAIGSAHQTNHTSHPPTSAPLLGFAQRLFLI